MLNKPLLSYFILFFLLIAFKTNHAQELNFKVAVRSQQVQGKGVDSKVFEILQTAIFEFMNNRRWTEDNYESNEKIDLNMVINITKIVSPTRFKSTIEIQVRRPIYNTSYYSILFNYSDKNFVFDYLENQPLEYAENTYMNNLTAVLGFYAHLAIGLDEDSFEMKGGTSQFQKALNIVNSVTGDLSTEWTSGTNNRYWMINNMLDATFIPLRECMYKYHRLGLDVMVSDKKMAIKNISEGINGLDRIHAIKPISFSVQLFFNAKSTEIINLYSEASDEEKKQIVALLKKINPINSSKYQKIL